MSGPILSLKWTALFCLLIISTCCNFGHAAAWGEAGLVDSPECGGYEGAACPEEEADFGKSSVEFESAVEQEPDEYASMNPEYQDLGKDGGIAKRGDGTEPGAFTAIVGCDGMAPRLPVMVLKNRHPNVFNILILALERVQNFPETRELSWFQLAGIHGFPFIPWQYPDSATVNPGLGYCTHNSAIFIPWHTPYLLLLEQLLWREARVIAAQFTGAERTRYMAAAQRVRLPYWDWASSGSQSRIPPALKEPQVTVIKPGVGSRTIPNPLYSYRFLRGSPGAGFGSTTRRGANDNTLAETFPSRRQSTLDLFTRTRYNDASNLLEGIHNGVHVFIGGDMPVVTRSAFDPIFWLHHVNVDRLMTMYQATHPGVTLTPRARSPTFALGGNGPDDLSTPLFPFRHPNGAEWRSSDITAATHSHQYGYYYPEVPTGLSQSALRDFTTRRINALYRPNLRSSEFQVLKARQDDPEPEVLTRTEWTCNVQYDMKELSGPSYQIKFYLDSNGAEHLVGVAAIFAGVSMPVEMPNSIVSMEVPLTPELVAPTPNLDAPAIVPFLTDQLKWTVERVNDDGSVTPVPVEDVPSLKIATFSTEAKYPVDESLLPSKGNETIYLDPTKGKDGGLGDGPVAQLASFIDSIGDDMPAVVELSGDDFEPVEGLDEIIG